MDIEYLESISPPLNEEILGRIKAWFVPYRWVGVAFSGGIDSTLVLRLALDALGKNRVQAFIADSPSLPRRELKHAVLLATNLGAQLEIIKTNELDRHEYQSNTGNRCYFCKHTLYSQLLKTLGDRHICADQVIVDGTNRDDLSDDRPGHVAAQEFTIRHPLVELDLGKSAVRRLAQTLGLSNWDKPASPCLSSRVPVGTAVTMELLGRIERAEDALLKLGYRNLRVRVAASLTSDTTTARIEFDSPDLAILLQSPERSQLVIESVLKAGFSAATIDTSGYRRGGATKTLPKLPVV